MNNTNYDTNTIASMSAVTITNSTNMESVVPQIKYKNGEFMGILEWKIEDESKIISRLVCELKPRLAITFLPGTPAYILFMCIRYADMLNDDERVRLLLNNSIRAVKKLINVKTRPFKTANFRRRLNLFFRC
jgi:myosin-5